MQDCMQRVHEIGLYLTVFGLSFSLLLNDVDLKVRELGILIDGKLEQR